MCQFGKIYKRKQFVDVLLFYIVQLLQAYIDKPTNIAHCYPKTQFVQQINQNFNTVSNRLFLYNLHRRCDFSYYKTLVKEMQTRTIAIVDAYFLCKDNDCTSAVMDAYKKFADYRSAVFNVYTKCSFTKYSSECAQILIQARPPVYASAENILTSLLTCSKLKSAALNGTGSLQFYRGQRNINSERDCNCVKIVCLIYGHKFSFVFNLKFSGPPTNP